jgi:serine/threonine protein kinase/Tfp pilus assembly protein PilF
VATKCPKCRFDNTADSKFCKECGTRLIQAENHPAFKTLTLETPAEGLSRGTLFAGRYEIIEELGTGGMGSVYRAEDTEIRQEVALKLIRPEIASSRRTIERFRNEIKTARMIAHRNVCRMFDLGEEKGTYFITMEYVSGEDMKSFLRRAAPLSPGRAISIAKQICEGLAEAHRLGVVHRDLKPGNIMIDKEGNARIMDFGIARSIAEKGITGTGVMIGTPEYMSPEQAEGKEADQRSDLYSLGVILFEMVTGRLPFEGETALSIAQKHRYEPASDPRTINPQIPEDISRLILRCLEKDKEIRYQTTSEVLADLEKIERQIPSTDRVTSTKRPFTSKEITVKFTLKKIFIPALAAGIMLIAAFLGWRFLSKKRPAAVPKIDNSIAVISLRNQTGDTSYDYLCRRSIPDLLSTKLESSGLYVATWERMLDVLKQMGKRDVQSIDSDLGFEICRREGIKFIVSGSLNKAGETFVADVKVLDAETLRSLKSTQSGGRGEDSILGTQIDQLSRDICAGLGIGGDKALAASPSIADMTTSSMEAYNHYLRGTDFYYQYKYRDARISLEKAVQIDPSFASAYRRLARVLQYFGDQGASEKAIEQAKLFSDRATEKEKLYIDVQTALMKGEGEQFGNYIPALKALVKKYPKEREAHEWLGGILWNSGDLDGSIKEWQTVLEIDPNFAEAYNSLSILNSLLRNYEKALDFAKKYASFLPDNGNTFDTIGGVYFDWGKLDEALANFKKATEKGPDLYGSYYGLIYASALREDYPEAMEWTNRLLGRNWPPGIQADNSVLKGFLELWLGRIERSFADFERAENLYKSVGDEIMIWFTTYCKAIAYYEKGEYELSQKFHNSAVNAYVRISGGRNALTRAELAYNLAWNDLMMGRLESAKARLGETRVDLPEITGKGEIRFYSEEGLKKKVAYLHELLEQEIAIREGKADIDKILKSFGGEPDYLWYFSNMWFVLQIADFVNFPPPFVRDIVPRAYIQKGDLNKAIATYEHLVTLYPQRYDRRLIHPRVHYRLAKLYEQTGHRDKAIARYKKFLDLWKDADPGRSEVEDARKRLESLS